MADHILVLDEARYLLNGGSPLNFNVAAGFGIAETRDSVLDLFERMAGHKLSPEQRDLAVKTGLQLVEGGKFSLGSLVRAWRTEPSLKMFAADLLDVAMPGPHDDA